jgi:hypothetical protein
MATIRQTIHWLRKLSMQGGKRGVVNNIDAKSLARVADRIEELWDDRNNLIQRATIIPVEATPNQAAVDHIRRAQEESARNRKAMGL